MWVSTRNDLSSSEAPDDFVYLQGVPTVEKLTNHCSIANFHLILMGSVRSGTYSSDDEGCVRNLQELRYVHDWEVILFSNSNGERHFTFLGIYRNYSRMYYKKTHNRRG